MALKHTGYVQNKQRRITDVYIVGRKSPESLVQWSQYVVGCNQLLKGAGENHKTNMVS